MGSVEGVVGDPSLRKPVGGVGRQNFPKVVVSGSFFEIFPETLWYFSGKTMGFPFIRFVSFYSPWFSLPFLLPLIQTPKGSLPPFSGGGLWGGPKVRPHPAHRRKLFPQWFRPPLNSPYFGVSSPEGGNRRMFPPLKNRGGKPGKNCRRIGSRGLRRWTPHRRFG